VNCEFINCTFSESDFSKCQFIGVSGYGNKVLKSNLFPEGYKLGKDGFIYGPDFINFTNANLTDCYVDAKNWSNSRLTKARIYKARFTDCDFTNADFTNANLDEVLFDNCDLTGANFNQARWRCFVRTKGKCFQNLS